MRKPIESASASNVVRLPQRPSSFPRRSLAPIPGNMTCLVLVKHGETDNELLVSDGGSMSTKAEWVPKSMLILDPAAPGKTFLVATLMKNVADQKRLSPYAFIDPQSCLWNEQQLSELEAAKSLAARNRNRLRNHHGATLGHFGRNQFA